MRLHPAFARQLARKWLETKIAAPLDRGQHRSLPRHAAHSKRPHRVSHNLQPQIMGPRKIGHSLDLDRQFGDDQVGSVSARVSGANAMRGNIPLA